MKKIKTEEIQSAIQNYLKQRNYNVPNVASQSSDIGISIPDDKDSIGDNKPLMNATTATTQRAAVGDLYTTSLNQMILNDMVLLESSISDFFAFTLSDSSTTSDHEYLSEFEM